MATLALISAGSHAWIAGIVVGIALGTGLGWLRRGKKAQTSKGMCCGPSALAASDTPQTENSGGPHVIRLSPPAGVARASEMTQQQKIAAALQRAGIEHHSWSTGGVSANPPNADNESSGAPNP